MSTQGPTIVSLIASATEIVCALGLRESLVGISHECDYPPDVLTLPMLSRPKIDIHAASAEIDRQVRAVVQGGLSVYQIDAERLSELAPDLIVTQDHCEVCAVSLADVEEAVCALTLKETRICTLHPSRLEDVFGDFEKVARAAGVPERGLALARAVRDRLSALEARVAGAPRPRTACIEWLDPPMVAGGWMPELIRIAGGEPVLVEVGQPFRTVSWQDIEAAAPDRLLLLPCGFKVEQSLAELRDPQLAARVQGVGATRAGQCFVCDGNAYFNRPGPRIAESAELMAALLHPDRVDRTPFADAVLVWP